MARKGTSVQTVLFYVQQDNEVPVLVPVEVLSREPDGQGPKLVD